MVENIFAYFMLTFSTQLRDSMRSGASKSFFFIKQRLFTRNTCYYTFGKWAHQAKQAALEAIGNEHVWHRMKKDFNYHRWTTISKQAKGKRIVHFKNNFILTQIRLHFDIIRKQTIIIYLHINVRVIIICLENYLYTKNGNKFLLELNETTVDGKLVFSGNVKSAFWNLHLFFLIDTKVHVGMHLWKS